MTDENKYKLVGPAPDLFASSSQIEEQINEKVPEEEEVETFEASVGDTVKGMGAEVAIALAGNASGAALAPFTLGISYPVASFIGGFGGSMAAQEIEGQPKFQVGRALFAGFANLIPAGNTLKAGANVSKLAYAGRVVRTGGVGSAVTVADTTAQAIIDERRLPTLKELGFSAAVGFAFGSTIDLATIKVAPTATKVWDKFTDKTKKLFLQMSGKTEDEINAALAQKLITREEVRHFKDLLVNEQYKDAGFVEGFLGNKVIDLNDIPLADRQGYIKDRLAYLDDLTEELTDQFSDGEIGSDIYTTKNKEWNTERQALRERQNEIAQSVREVINEDGSFNIDESQSSEVSEPQSEINVTETTQGETQPLEVTVGGEKIPSDVPEVPVTPKPDAEANPAPVTPEVAPSKAEDFVNLVNSLLKGDRSRLKGVKGTNEVARLFDDYKNRLNTVIEGLKTGHSTLEEASALLDELVTVAPKKYELDNVDGSSMAVRRADREPENFQEIMTEESAEIVADIERLRDNLNFQKDVGENFENLDALRKRILGDVEDVPVVETPDAKPKKPTAVPEDKVDTPKPTARQARIAKLEEETNLLHALVSGEDISQIDGVAGIHPSLKPKGGNTDVPTYEQFLKKRKAELIKAAKELQKAEINVVKDRILNPAIYKRHWIDKALDLNFLARTSSGLSAPTSMTAGVFSAAVNIAITPIRNMLGSSLWKGMTLKNKSIVRKALYAGSDLAAYQDAFMTIFNRSAYKDFGKALINRGKNPLFSDGDVRFKEGYNSDGAGNARELATQRKQLKRNENQQGLKNTFARIKALDSAAEVAMELINLPYTVIGAVDVPFTLAMITGKLRAEGLRAGIDQEVPDLAKFVDEYIEAAFKEQNGKRVWAYKQHYEKIRQQADEGLFKNRKLEDDDIRKTATESLLDIASKHTTQGTIGGRVLQVLMWVITTPSIVVTKGTKFALSPMLEPLRHVGKATATLAPNSEFNTRANKIMGQDKASFKTLRSDIKNLKEALETAVSSKQKAIIEKELIQKNDSLKVVEARLEKNKARMAEMDSESLGNALMATGMYVMFWNMSEKDMITGGGHWMNDDQRRDSTFQPYMMLRDNGTGGHDYRMAEPYRIVTSIIADVQKWHQYKEEGLLTEDQLDLSAMMARTVRGILQDSPFTGGVKNVMRVLSPTSAQETRKEVVVEMALGAVPGVPNIVKAPIRAQQQYFDDRSQTKGLGDRVYQNLAAAPAPNLKRDEYGRPKERNKKSLANAVFRTAKQGFPSSLLREQKLDEILEQDNRLGNIIGPISSSYKTHDMKGYWKNGKTIYEDFQVFMLTFENSNGLTMMDESLEIIESDGWEESYNNGRLGSLNALEEMQDIDDAYDENGNLKGGISKDSNEGLEKIRDAKRATIEEAKKEFFTAERVEQYQNRDGDNPAQALIQQQQFEKNWGWMPQN